MAERDFECGAQIQTRTLSKYNPDAHAARALRRNVKEWLIDMKDTALGLGIEDPENLAIIIGLDDRAKVAIGDIDNPVALV